MEQEKYDRLDPTFVDWYHLGGMEIRMNCRKCQFVGCFSQLVLHVADAHGNYVDRGGLDSFQCLTCDRSFLTKSIVAAHKCTSEMDLKDAFLNRKFKGARTACMDDLLAFLGDIGRQVMAQADDIAVNG